VELAQTMVTLQGRPRELLPGSTSLWKSPHVNPWDAMFGIFIRWCITHHDSMHCFFHFFDFFLDSPAPLRDLGQNHGAIDVCQVGWEPWFGLGSRVPHPQGTSLYFSPILLVCISCSPSAKLDWNGFRAKIIHYMAAGRDNS
jgi:hypothetical protein